MKENSLSILKKIEARLPDAKVFEERIIKDLETNYFVTIYQALYEKTKPLSSDKFSTDEFKDLLKYNNYVNLINDVYSTRLSTKGLEEINRRLQNVEDYNDYQPVLRLFAKCNPSKNTVKNAFSLGTKVLHNYNPEENPILDSVVMRNTGIRSTMSLNLCLSFKEATTKFVDDHEEYFILENHAKTLSELEKRNLLPNIPKMKLLDMALYSS